MLGRNHIIVNMAGAAAITSTLETVGIIDLSGTEMIGPIALFVIGSILPDCDSRGSLINQTIHTPIPYLVKHRGVLHSIPCLFLLLFLCIPFPTLLRYFSVIWGIYLWTDVLSMAFSFWEKGYRYRSCIGRVERERCCILY